MGAILKLDHLDRDDLFRKLAMQVMDENQSADQATLERRFVEAVKRKHLQDAAIAELAEHLIVGGDVSTESRAPKSKISASERMKRLKKMAARIARQMQREAELMCIVQERVRVALDAECTMHELWKRGGALSRLGKRNDPRLVTKVYTKVQLEKAFEKAGIGKA
jgi:hypothetical protein